MEEILAVVVVTLAGISVSFLLSPAHWLLSMEAAAAAQETHNLEMIALHGIVLSESIQPAPKQHFLGINHVH